MSRYHRWRDTARERPPAVRCQARQPLSHAGISTVAHDPCRQTRMVIDASSGPPWHPFQNLLALAMLVLADGQTAYYAMLEKLGYPKRALLVSRVQ